MVYSKSNCLKLNLSISLSFIDTPHWGVSTEEQEVNMIMNKIFVEFQTIFREINDEQKQTIANEIQNFATNLVKWATNIRKTFEIGAIEDTISSRRLIFIVKYWLLTNCKKKDAIAFCISRFSPEIQESMLKLYEPISGE